MTKKIYSRRQFLGTAAANGNKAPSERIGIVGCGAMNGGHTQRYIHSDDAKAESKL